jgi:hypothetical protein
LLGQIAALGFAKPLVPGQDVTLALFVEMVSELIHQEILGSLAVS